MVEGLSIFRDRFRPFGSSFILIGGAACDEWFAAQRLAFRATRDLDIVLLLESIDHAFVAAVREFVAKGGYEIRQRTDQRPILYRFEKPADRRYPVMLELFSRNPEGLDLAEGQRIMPVEVAPGHRSLSAILLDEAYYELIRTEHETRDGLRFATVRALIPLKARAWLDLTMRRERGEKIDPQDILKHRNDVFRLAAILPGAPGPALPDVITADLIRFLDDFPESSPDWSAILASLRAMLGRGLRPASLRGAILAFFRLPGA